MLIDLSRAVLVEGGLEEPRAIALHPGLGYYDDDDYHDDHDHHE